LLTIKLLRRLSQRRGFELQSRVLVGFVADKTDVGRAIEPLGMPAWHAAAVPQCHGDRV
jgi:hypothetical protein